MNSQIKQITVVFLQQAYFHAQIYILIIIICNFVAAIFVYNRFIRKPDFLILKFLFVIKIFLCIWHLANFTMIDLNLFWLVDRFSNRWDWSRSSSMTLISRSSVMVCTTTLSVISFDFRYYRIRIQLHLKHCSCRSIFCSNSSFRFSMLILLSFLSYNHWIFL